MKKTNRIRMVCLVIDPPLYASDFLWSEFCQPGFHRSDYYSSGVYRSGSAHRPAGRLYMLQSMFQSLHDSAGWSMGTHALDRKSTRLNSSHVAISYDVFCSKKKTRRKHKHKVTAHGRRKQG